MKKLIRTIHPQVKIIDAHRGVADYVASDETLDSYHEIIRAGGWKFNHFAKNSPFVDSHDYSTIEKCLGKVVDFKVENGRLVERVQWAIDVPENKLAQIGWKMTEAGYLKAVSVGFHPTRYIFPDGSDTWRSALAELGMDEKSNVRAIYLEQEQVELSSCILGANPNALARAYKAGAIDDADLDTLSRKAHLLEPVQPAAAPALAAWACEQARKRFMEKLQHIINKQ